jgi:hypothetical protein
MDSAGKLTWDPFPRASGSRPAVRPHDDRQGQSSRAGTSGRGLECDKLSKEAAEAHFNGLMGRLIADNPALAGKGKVLVSTHIDSWEVGSQNWTPRMREEFHKRRGYDLLPLLPTFTGRVVDSLEVSERFLWDLRQTVSDMLVENYAGHIRTLANRHGLRLSIEAYDGVPCDEDDLRRPGGRADVGVLVVGQVRRGLQLHGDGLRGPRLRQADPRRRAFTATDAEKWLGHPANIKDLGDWAFCEGVNRFVFHRYAMQPWTNPDRAPGMSMGPWGLHYERTQTWWEQSKAWHEYLARCQYLLQQGLFVADVCYLQPEGAPRRFVPPPTAMIAPYIRGGYNFDGCTPEVVLTRMSVQDGRIVLPDGMSYRLLVLPQVETMTPALLGKIKELVAAGATVVAPLRSAEGARAGQLPGLRSSRSRRSRPSSGVPTTRRCHVTERRVGKGRILWGGELSPNFGRSGQSSRSSAPRSGSGTRKGNPAVSSAARQAVLPPHRHLASRSRIASARLVMTADNEFVCYVNGRRVGAGDNFNQAYVHERPPAALKPGANLIAVDATNTTDRAQSGRPDRHALDQAPRRPHDRRCRPTQSWESSA